MIVSFQKNFRYFISFNMKLYHAFLANSPSSHLVSRLAEHHSDQLDQSYPCSALIRSPSAFSSWPRIVMFEAQSGSRSAQPYLETLDPAGATLGKDAMRGRNDSRPHYSQS